MHRRERWSVEAGTADVATLVIPADAQRDRRFEISCRFVVAQRAGDNAFHGMRIDVDGALEWSRRLPTQNPGHTDSIDYRFRRDVPAGQPVRVRVKTEVRGAARISVTIEADEE
ncbi:MAG TPA: hypothetical protein VFP68_21415 [Burkholderiaceae bacterium]|nr:hypothetical protein [Burkholderiaceae bacterium]